MVAKSGETLFSEDDSQKIAADYLRTSPTFAFDGIDSSVKLLTTTRPLEKSDSWQFEYQFQCQQAGYGDRLGQMLAQVITTHRAQVVVREGKITHAILDDRWDMLSQKLVPGA